jgi:hypothetical protein
MLDAKLFQVGFMPLQSAYGFVAFHRFRIANSRVCFHVFRSCHVLSIPMRLAANARRQMVLAAACASLPDPLLLRRSSRCQPPSGPSWPDRHSQSGANASTELDLLDNVVAKVDVLIIGGGMANTFLAAQGSAVGMSLCERGLGATALRVLASAKAHR